MSEFQYKEVDREGWDTLDAIAAADKFNYWMYQTIRPFCQGKILEIGSGIGNISQFFLEEQADITLSDIRSVYCDQLRKKFPAVRGVIELDLVHPSFEKEFSTHLHQYDAVFALNVVEHIQDDGLAITNARKLLREKGKLVILVPAYQHLYNRFDKELEHFRRYNRKRLNQLISDHEFSILHSQYFNFMGIFGWYVSGRLQKNKIIPKSQMSLYNKLVPAFKLVDKVLLHRVGLSVISVGLAK